MIMIKTLIRDENDSPNHENTIVINHSLPSEFLSPNTWDLPRWDLQTQNKCLKMLGVCTRPVQWVVVCIIPVQ